ncbi:hypothetical protein AABM17_2678 [Neisseria musculi]|uniref:Uncharacterized protein n=1 Tax=Neisseria musculi TaxID=1815583 RepID=A0A7H1MEE6_9NEIS|nr:hypothetical protein H7A79_2677 [Neisseria musculi]
MFFVNTVKLEQMPFCLIPKAPDSVNVILPFCKPYTVVDAKAAESARIKYIITFHQVHHNFCSNQPISIDNAVRLYLSADNRQ